MASRSLSYRAYRRRQRIKRSLVYLFLSVIAILWILPFCYLFLQSFASIYAPSNVFPYLPTQANIAAKLPVWTMDNYRRLFTDANYPFWRWWLNTFVIALVSTLAETALTLGFSYALSRLSFKGRKGLMKLILILGMFPGFLTMIAIYYIFKLLGMETSIFSVIIVYVANAAMAYYIPKGFFDTVPKSLDEAAMLDGASQADVLFKIVMPLAKPIAVYVLLISFISPWGDFMIASYLAGGNHDNMTVAVGLEKFLEPGMDTYFPVFCAGAVLVSIPIVILFFFLQKYYVEGITGGAVKG